MEGASVKLAVLVLLLTHSSFPAIYVVEARHKKCHGDHGRHEPPCIPQPSSPPALPLPPTEPTALSPQQEESPPAPTLPPTGAPWSTLSPDMLPLAPTEGVGLPLPPARAPLSTLSPADMLTMAPGNADIGVPYGYVFPPGYQAPPYQTHVCGWPCRDSNDCDGPCTACCYNPSWEGFCRYEDYYLVPP